MKLEQNESRNEDAWSAIASQRMIMSRIVVEDKVKVNLFGGMSVKYTQKLQKFLMAMARQTLSDYFSIQSIQGGKQGRGSIAFVIMSQCFRCPYFIGNPGWYDPALEFDSFRQH